MKKILWCVDPLEGKPSLRKSCLDLVTLFSERTKASVEPIYILSDGVLGLSVSKAVLNTQIKSSIERAFDSFLLHVKIPKLLNKIIIIKPNSSISTCVKALDQYASRTKADLIVVASHGRSGFSRLLMGSFAEELVLSAKSPVLISGPQNTANGKIDKILFPTDFSTDSKKAFIKTLSIAKDLGSRVYILNVLVNPMEPLLQSGVNLLGGGYVSFKNYSASVANKQTEKSKEWVILGKKMGVAVDFKFLSDQTSIAEGVLSFAGENKVNIISIASQSSGIATNLIGSVGRVIARESKCPVLVL